MLVFCHGRREKTRNPTNAKTFAAVFIVTSPVPSRKNHAEFTACRVATSKKKTTDMLHSAHLQWRAWRRVVGRPRHRSCRGTSRVGVSVQGERGRSYHFCGDCVIPFGRVVAGHEPAGVASGQGRPHRSAAPRVMSLAGAMHRRTSKLLISFRLKRKHFLSDARDSGAAEEEREVLAFCP